MNLMRTGTLLCFVLLGGVAIAGSKTDYPVFVDTANRAAMGSVGSARNSADTVQSIGCDTEVRPGLYRVSCVAVTSSRVIGSCSSTDPRMIEAVRSITDSSFIQFQWNASSVCTVLIVSNSSDMAPKL